jgi:hypothetical protein
VVDVDTDGEKLVLFPGKIVRKNGALAFRGPSAQFFLPVVMGKVVWLQKVGEQEEVCVGVRASSIRVSDGAKSGDVCVLGNVETKSCDGLNQHIIVRIGASKFAVEAGNGSEFSDGDSIRLQFSRSDAVLFRGSPDSINPQAISLALAAI